VKIAIDLDGTAWFHREFFKDFVNAMQFFGHEIGILTSHNCNLKTKDLELWKQGGFPEPDFYICKTDDEKKELKETPGNNGTWKARMVREYSIDYLFDDLDGNEQYIDYFTKECPYTLFRVFGDK